MTWYSSVMPLPPWMSRAALAMSSALPQLLRLSMVMAGGEAVPDRSGVTGGARLRPSAISVSMSASFFCTN